jgi:hypothetical protein
MCAFRLPVGDTLQATFAGLFERLTFDQPLLIIHGIFPWVAHVLHVCLGWIMED